MATCVKELDLSDGRIIGAKYVGQTPPTVFKKLFTTDGVVMSRSIERAEPQYCSEGDTCDRELLSETATSTRFSLAIETKDLNDVVRGLFAGGQSTPLLQTAGTAETFAIPLSVKGSILDVGAKKISNYNLDTDPATTPFTEGVDYEVNATHGTIEVLEGGTITDDSVLTFTFDKAQITDGYSVSTGGSCDNTWYLIWLGRNKEGKDTKITFGKIDLTAVGEKSLKQATKSYGAVSIEGICLKPESGHVYIEEVA